MKRFAGIFLVVVMVLSSVFVIIPPVEVKAETGFQQQNILQMEAPSSSKYISGEWCYYYYGALCTCASSGSSKGCADRASDSVWNHRTIHRSGCGIVALVSAIYNTGNSQINKDNISTAVQEFLKWGGDKGYWLREMRDREAFFGESDDQFGSKYGFEISSMYGNTLTSLINHIKSGDGTAVIRVYGHYMVAVDYKKENGVEYLRVFDPFPGADAGVATGNYSTNRRGITHGEGDWFSVADLQDDGGTKGNTGTTAERMENIEIVNYWLVSATANNTYDFLFPANIGEVSIKRPYDSSASHNGIDIVSTGDQLVYAAFSGTVTRISNSCNHVHYNAKCDHYSSWGNSIYIKSEDGKIYGIYGHLKQDSFLVKVGDTVERGQPIASMGSSGFSSERQAHFEIRTDTSSSKYSINVNPYNASSNPGVVAYSTTGYKPIVSDAIDEGTYTFANDDYNMYMKQDANASGTIGASNASVTSKFNFRIIKDGNFYRIVPEDGANNYLRSAWNDSQNTHSVSGAEVILGANDANNYSQKWIFEKYGDGYIIHPACTPAFAITRDGNSLIVKKTDYSAAQIWILESTECTHSYEYKQNDTIGSVHWQECTKCGIMINYAAHVWQSSNIFGDNDELYFLHLNYCSICGVEYTDYHNYHNDCDDNCNDCGYIRQPDHVFEFSCDEFCNGCGYTRYAEHVFDDPCDMDCNYGCGYIRQVEHFYSNACDSSCNVCGTIRPITHTYSDNYDATCDVCGSTRDIAHVHSYGDYEYDFYGHWRVCLDCGEADGVAKSHTVSGMSEVNDSYHGGECSVCGGKFTYKHTYTDDCDTSCNECENIREVTHFYTDDNDNICNSCGYERNKECQVHTFGAWTVTVEPTCISNGVMTRYCDNCEYFETKEISREAHNDADGNGACDSCNRTIEEVDNTVNDKLDVQVSGCGSVIGGSLWFVVVILVSTVAIATDKKRKY